MKVILIVLDSVGIGAAPDASDYGDAGSATIPHLAQATGGINLPNLQKLGLGNIPALLPGGIPIEGCPPSPKPLASYGAMQEVSEGKDTITGHWEMAGLKIIPGFHLFPKKIPAFPDQLTRTLEEKTGRKIIGNKHASGTAIIEELGEEHLRTGALICYTSADSVLQIAANTEHTVPLEELYRCCEIARELCDDLKVGRVIARPFIGKPGSFKRTEHRRDYAFKAEEPFITERLTKKGVGVYAVGKIEDIIANRGITESNHTGNTAASQQAVEAFMQRPGDGFIWANFIDFDMLYGHRRDPQGYAEALRQSDQWLGQFMPSLSIDDLLIITADHGNDPTFTGTDHTREFVPLLMYRPGSSGQNLGVRQGFYDIAQTVADVFGLADLPWGRSCLR